VLVIIAAALVLLFIKEPKIYTDAEKPPGLISSLRELIKDEDKSAVFLLAAIFFWVLTTQQADTFLTLYATRHLGISEGDAGRLAGHLGILFLLFAIPAGVLGGRIGRRKTITIGILSMALFIFLIAVLSKDFLTIFITHIPILGRIRAANLFLMASGISWAFININALPMVVDLTSADRIGTYTGFYFLAYTLSSVVGPILNGWIILLAGHNYNMIMIIGPIALFISLFFLSRVKKGEPLPNSA
jgi:MFS family permease